MAFTSFREMKPFSQLMFSIFVMLVSVLTFLIVGLIVAIPFIGVDGMIISISSSGVNAPENVVFLKYMQVLQSVGLFVIPPFILGWLYHDDLIEYLQINRSARVSTFLFGGLAVAMLIPFVNWIGELNGQMKLPESLSGIEQWMRNMEDAAKVLTEKFMKVDGISGLLFNVFMFAVIPALGEELMFRGVVQRIFTSWTKNYHWGIWISAFLFSAMHLQFYGFFPRMALGAMFGYLLVWSGTMWLPILAHFVNNTMIVFGYYLIDKGIISKDIEEWGTDSGQFPLVLLSLALAGLLLFLVFRNGTQTKMPVNQFDSQASRLE